MNTSFLLSFHLSTLLQNIGERSIEVLRRLDHQMSLWNWTNEISFTSIPYDFSFYIFVLFLLSLFSFLIFYFPLFVPSFFFVCSLKIQCHHNLYNQNFPWQKFSLTSISNLKIYIIFSSYLQQVCNEKIYSKKKRRRGEKWRKRNVAQANFSGCVSTMVHRNALR